MKAKLFLKATVLAVVAIVCVSPLFAQDSTIVKIADDSLNAAAVKYPTLVTIFAVLGVVTECLGFIPDKYVPVNGVLSTIIKWVKAVTGGLKK